MKIKNIYRLILFMLIMVSCTETDQGQFQEFIAQVGQTAVADGADFAMTQVAALQKTAEVSLATEVAEAFATMIAPQSSDDILQRVKAWVDAHVSFDPAQYQDGYVTDSAGFISYVWQLPAPGVEIDTFVDDEYAIEILVDELQPGDVLNNKVGGRSGHVIIFYGWRDGSFGKFNGYDMHVIPGYASKKVYTLEYSEAGWIIKELEQWGSGPYFAQRLIYDP
jgi:hypothetical protein